MDGSIHGDKSQDEECCWWYTLYTNISIPSWIFGGGVLLLPHMLCYCYLGVIWETQQIVESLLQGHVPFAVCSSAPNITRPVATISPSCSQSQVTLRYKPEKQIKHFRKTQLFSINTDFLNYHGLTWFYTSLCISIKYGVMCQHYCSYDTYWFY